VVFEVIIDLILHQQMPEDFGVLTLLQLVSK
jgi:hypothetical protein